MRKIVVVMMIACAGAGGVICYADGESDVSGGTNATEIDAISREMRERVNPPVSDANLAEVVPAAAANITDATVQEPGASDQAVNNTTAEQQ
jgi:hypothetical protein